MSGAAATSDNYDRTKEVQAFEELRIGVKGLLDSGITSIPRIFHHPPENLPNPNQTSKSNVEIPVIDLSGDRKAVVDQIRRACGTIGFFQIINHGIPSDILSNLISGIRSFHHQPFELKAEYHNRDLETGASFFTNGDLFHSKAASWRDTLRLSYDGQKLVHADRLPEICRSQVVEWDPHMTQVGETLLGLLSEGLGVEEERLKKIGCMEGRIVAAHYYPYCPEPDRTIGIVSHTDPAVMAVVLQDQIGGLQVKDGDCWVDVKPTDGALVVNVGDILQIISNDEYKSVEHRVVANRRQEPRVSITAFFNPGKREDLYGPLPEVTSSEKPARYRHFKHSEFMRKIFEKKLDSKSLMNQFKL